MKIGLSTYSLSRKVQSGEMTIFDVIQWIADHGGEHVEIVPLDGELEDNRQLVEDIRKKAETVGIDISNYAVGANFIGDSEEEFEREIEKTLRKVDTAHALGAKLMRHDVAFRPVGETSIRQFVADFPRLVEACRRIADYAQEYGITTSIENHGFYVQASDRVQQLVTAVDRPNFKTTLDVGNFLCVDEDPVAAVKSNLPYASIVHLKDFYWRPSYRNPGEGWFQTAHGNYLRGAIVGQGDIDMWEIVKIVKNSGYDGYVSIEFEGMEDCALGSKIGMENARRLWDEV